MARQLTRKGAKIFEPRCPTLVPLETRFCRFAIGASTLSFTEGMFGICSVQRLSPTKSQVCLSSAGSFFFAVFFCPAQSCRELTAFYSGDRSIFLHNGHSSIDVQSQSKNQIIQMKGLREIVLLAWGRFAIAETIQQWPWLQFEMTCPHLFLAM